MSLYYQTYQRVGLKGLFEMLYSFRRVKVGTYVGTDSFGTKYWENNDLPYGQHRWCEPAEYESPQLWDASKISPEWHGWMHSQNDIVPTDNKPLPTGDLMLGTSDVPAELFTHQQRNVLPWRGNPTLNRERGYGVRNMFQTQVGGNGYYTSPGNVSSPRHVEFISEARQAQWKMAALKVGETTKQLQFRAQREAITQKEEQLALAATSKV
ncbi:hypothetical protein BASA81_008544 [Batrachochytrium salamandrivorans]|nr:hypothetical protein BASA81_008544 [Batrachochytrium salamandrivorans]